MGDHVGADLRGDGVSGAGERSVFGGEGGVGVGGEEGGEGVELE